MDAFTLHHDVLENYKEYLRSFTLIKDERIRQKVDQAFDEGTFLPEPLIQFNPGYEGGKTLQQFVDQGLVHRDLPGIFGTYQLYRHQSDAIELAVAGQGFIVTSGTGSGKSLTYLACIFDHILKQAGQQKGVKAILVYPMNALINSQEEEIRKFHLNYLLDKIKPDNPTAYKQKPIQQAIEELENRYEVHFPVSYKKYTGQENKEYRENVRQIEPDIILTNYMMLELIMTRQAENWMRDSLSANLKYLVFDELHTYRGRQGSDVSFLIRRIKYQAQNELIFIGTSATMATEGSRDDRKEAVAKVARTIFSVPFTAGQVIEESLTAITNFGGILPAPEELNALLEKVIMITGNNVDFLTHPLTIWLENAIALSYKEELVRRGKPISLSQMADQLAEYSDINVEIARERLIQLLNWSEELNRTDRQYMPFKLHQFISQVSTVFVTLEPKDSRQIIIEQGRYFKDESNREQFLYPVLFSRHSGHEYICVELDSEENLIKPRDPEEIPHTLNQKEARGENLTDATFSSGYLVLPYAEEDELWTDDFIENLPETWWRIVDGRPQLLPFYSLQLPRKIYFNSEGNYSFEPKYPDWAWYTAAKLRVDFTAGVVYEDVKTKENTKLMRLGSEGRSTATTITAFEVIRQLHSHGEKTANQKLLSFTDNRQDASLQSGHFNDFLSTVRLRSAIYHALQDNSAGLTIDDITERMVEKLALKEDDYANNPNPDWPDEENERALKDYLLIRVMYDLQRGWRYTLPNLEQAGLLRIEYHKLGEFVQQERFFSGMPLFENYTADKRKEVIQQVLDYYRTSFAIYHRKLVEQRAVTENTLYTRLDNDKLWSLDKNERIKVPFYLSLRKPGRTRGQFFIASIGPRSYIGKYFKRLFKSDGKDFPKGDEYDSFMESVCAMLKTGNFLLKEEITGDRGTVNGYRLRTDKILWKYNEAGTVPVDKVRLSNFSDLNLQPNRFFRDMYRFNFTSFQKEVVGREHTGQLSSEERIPREDQFRKGILSALFCSPTMELGIDIADLNVVHMRNVPPNPANYAQRSGRAGRSGQAAVILTYCSSWSPHDRHYFKQREDMVSGSVVPPRIDLINEELVRSHFNAFILMRLGLESVRVSAGEVLDLPTVPQLPIKPDLVAYIEDQVSHHRDEWMLQFRKAIDDLIPDLRKTFWFNDKWLEIQSGSFLTRFDQAFDRLRNLYRNALQMQEKAQIVIDDPRLAYDTPEKKEARRQRTVSEKQLSLLRNERNRDYGNESEFYIFRYLASEGFLPGYNFTRLPVRTFVGYKHQDVGEYISRPRFLALREFGPLNLIYHNGSKYKINRMILVDAEARNRAIKISKQTGYAFLDDDAARANNDPITKQQLSGENNVEILNNLLEIGESEGTPQERISCEEEERMKRGFDTSYHFRYPGGLQNTQAAVIKAGDQPLLRVMYGPATELIQLNRRWQRSAERNGFPIDNRSGKWLRQVDLNNEETAANARTVILFARDTADTLYIQPVKDLGVNSDQIVSLCFALKRGIESLFQVEESEIGVQVLGNADAPNILIYESAEGSLGILSQLIQSPTEMKRLFVEAYRIMHFDPDSRKDTRPDLPKATYDDLLSYYNQPHHDVLDRYSIKEVLERLMDCTVENVRAGRDREAQYQMLLEHYDKNSGTELKFIEFIYHGGYALPDRAQVDLPGFYINADFVYDLETGPVLIFCDGSVHDQAAVMEDDRQKRQLLRDSGYDVIEWHYTEPLEELVERRKDVFRKVV